MMAAVTLFFIAIYSDGIYYHIRFRFEKKDLICTAAVTMVGCVLLLLLRNNAYGFLAGAFAAGGNFVLLLAKYMGKEIDTHD